MPFSRDLLVMNCHVAGPSHIEGIEEILKALEPGIRLKLVREPDNEFDDMAVLVLWDERKIGYLPRRNNEVIARLMDYGKYFYAVVSRVEKYMPDLPDRLEIGGYERYL